MTTTRLGALALGLFAIWMVVKLLVALPSMSPPAEASAAVKTTVFALLGAQVLVAGLLLRFRFALAVRLFGEEDEECGRASALDVQVAGFAMLGVWLAVEHLTVLVRATVAKDLGSLLLKQNGSVAGSVVGLVLALFLVFRGEWIARLWRPRSTETAS